MSARDMATRSTETAMTGTADFPPVKQRDDEHAPKQSQEREADVGSNGV